MLKTFEIEIGHHIQVKEIYNKQLYQVRIFLAILESKEARHYFQVLRRGIYQWHLQVVK